MYQHDKVRRAVSLLLVLCLCASVLTGCGTSAPTISATENRPYAATEATRPALPAEIPSSAPTMPEADRFPSIPEELEDHFLIQSRRLGFCDILSGNVGITVIYVDDGESTWTREEMDAYTEALYADSSELCHAASFWDVDIHVSIHTVHCALPEIIWPNTTDASVPAIMEAAGLTSTDMNLALEETLGVDEAPVIYVLNKHGRAYAQQSAGNEYCFLYADSTSFFHELTHLFGSEDYYFHPELEQYARAFFSESIMLDSTVSTVDDMTAYLIGWTDELTQDAYGFLTCTATISPESLDAARDMNTYTGYGTREYEVGTYVGDFVFGSPNGTGTMYYTGGGVYEGQWVDGQCHGFGTFTWTNGDCYEGEWVMGARTGYGCYRWSNGTVYEGDFVDGNRTGQGTLTYPSGFTQTGRWENNVFLG